MIPENGYRAILKWVELLHSSPFFLGDLKLSYRIPSSRMFLARLSASRA